MSGMYGGKKESSGRGVFRSDPNKAFQKVSNKRTEGTLTLVPRNGVELS